MNGLETVKENDTGIDGEIHVFRVFGHFQKTFYHKI